MWFYIFRSNWQKKWCSLKTKKELQLQLFCHDYYCYKCISSILIAAHQTMYLQGSLSRYIDEWAVSLPCWAQTFTIIAFCAKKKKNNHCLYLNYTICNNYLIAGHSVYDITLHDERYVLVDYAMGWPEAAPQLHMWQWWRRLGFYVLLKGTWLLCKATLLSVNNGTKSQRIRPLHHVSMYFFL